MSSAPENTASPRPDAQVPIREHEVGRVARRPIEAWSRPMVHTGLLLLDDEPPRVSLYGVLEGGITALLEPSGSGPGFRLEPVPVRSRAVLVARHPDLKLVFRDDPMREVWLARERPQKIEPGRIKLILGKDGATHTREGGVLGGDWDEDVLDTTFDETEFFQALREHFVDGRSWDAVGADRVAGDFNATDGRVSLDRRLAELDALYETVGGGRARGKAAAGRLSDEITVAVGRDGRYRLVSGRNALAVAKLAGLARVRVKVVARHRDWEALREEVIRHAGQHRGRLYQRVDHPDLADLRSGHDDTDDRVPILKRAFEGYDAQGKRLMDIGAHWAQMSLQMERLGFDVVAVEANERSAEMAERLRVAAEARFEVWPGSAFEFPRLAEQEVILALNIFHHFIKSKEGHDSLVDLLERSDPDMIVFAAHSSTAAPEMRDAYRNFEASEFAEFVSSHSGLPEVERLGESGDGRALFKVYR